MTIEKQALYNTPSIPPSFWEYFSKASNDRAAPLILDKKLLKEQLLTVEDGFLIAKNIIRSRDVTVNADGKMLESASIPPFPASFSGFEQFVRDFAKLNNAEGITFTRDYCLKHSSEAAMKLRSFTHGYIEHYGMPSPGANAVFIGGRYRSTWIGLHNDSCDTFLFPLYGKKRMMIWPPEYFDEMALQKKSALNGVCFGHVDITPYAKDATVYEVFPGEIFFIPAGWWHYNKLDELETTLTLSVGMFSHGSVGGFCENPLKAALESRAAHTPLGTVPTLPSGVFKSLSDIKLPSNITPLLDSIRDNCKVQMLLKISANGVIRNGVMTRATPLIGAQTVLSGRYDSPLFLVASETGSGLLFGGGCMVTIDHWNTVQPLISLANSGNTFNVANAIQTAEASDEIIKIIQWLYVRGAINILSE